MKKLILISLMFASLVQASDNWNSQSGPVTNSSNLCWRNNFWTPATADAMCDGAIQPAVTVKSPKEKPAPVTKVVEAGKLTYLAQSLFDFDKSVIKPEGKQALDQLILKLNTMTVEIAIVVGHTDSVGTDGYNLGLGIRRAEAVKKYLVSRGVEASRVYTDSKGEREPVASNKTVQGRSENRRVVVEVYGVPKYWNQ